MDGASIGVALAITVGLIVCSVAAFVGICCCCCAIPLFKIFASLFSSDKSNIVYQSSASRTTRGGEYELVNSAENGYQHHSHFVEPSAPPMAEAVIAHDYLVPPLAEVQTVNADASLGGEDSTRLQELHAQTAENKDGGFRDVWAAVLFAFNVVAIVYLAVQSIYLLKMSSSSADTGVETDSKYDLGILKVVAVFTVLLSVMAVSLGSWVLSFLIRQAENLIEYVMWGNIGMQAICAILCLLSLQIFGAIIFAVLAGLNYWYLISVRDRIPFSSAVLATACAGVKANYSGLVTTAFSALFAQMIWALLWTVAFVGVLYSTDNHDADSPPPVNGNAHLHDHGHTFRHHPTGPAYQDDIPAGTEDDGASSVRGFYMFLLFVSLYWGIQVIKAVVQTTVAGTIACWWFQPARESPVRGSLFRAVTTSFGSVCFGSLLVAVIQALRELLQSLRKRAVNGRNGRSQSAAGACAVCILDTLLSWIERALQYFNKYAYCYVAAYGLGFVQSGRLVTSLFYNRGWTAIISDNLISNALSCGVVALTVANMVGGILLSFLVDLFVAHNMRDMGTLALIGGIVGAVAGLIVGIVLTNALDSAVAMVFVCFAEDPLALQKNHPETYEVLRTRWDYMHPNTLAWCNGCSSVPSAASVSRPVSVSAPVSVPGSHHGHHGMQTAPSTGGVGGTGQGNVGIVYPTAGNVYAQPGTATFNAIHGGQPQQQGNPKLAAQYAPLSNISNPYVVPQGVSPYTGASPGAYGGGGYGGYGGYGAASSVGTHGSPSSAVYNPNYNGANMNMYAGQPPAQAPYAGGHPGQHHQHGQHGQQVQPPLVVARPVSNYNPSVPPGGYV